MTVLYPFIPVAIGLLLVLPFTTVFLDLWDTERWLREEIRQRIAAEKI